MHKKLFLILILHPCLLLANSIFISQNENKEEEIDQLNAYDPFTDYIDFQDTNSETEDMSFFQTGRVLSIGFYGGYRHFIFRPDQERNTTNSGAVGAFIKNFANLHIATQFSYMISSHLFSYTDGSKLQQSITFYQSFGVEFRYYWNRRRLVRTLARLNPYIAGGTFVNRRSLKLQVDNTGAASASHNSFGLKGGFGLEYHLSARFYLGLHAEYNFIFINQEECVNSTVCPPENMIDAVFVFGRNF